MRVHFTLIVLCSMLPGAASTPASQPAERLYSTRTIELEVVFEKLPVKLPEELAMHLFDAAQPGKLASDWRLQVAALQITFGPAANTQPLPPSTSRERAPASVEPFASITTFSQSHLIVRILRPLTDDSGHRVAEDVAAFEVKRNAALDELFGMAGITQTFATPYKGIGQGDTEVHMIEVLGPPESVRDTPVKNYHLSYYDNRRVEIAIWNGMVSEIQHPAD